MSEGRGRTMRWYRHPRIFTGAGEDDFATAFGVGPGVDPGVDGGGTDAGAVVTWVGEAEDVPAGAEVVDLPGALVVPGLVDAHTHPTYLARTIDAVACLPPTVHSIEEMVAALRGEAASRPDGWVTGWGYDESLLAERRTPTRHDLDRVSTGRPVHVLRSDMHSGVCNTKALEVAGVTRDTPDPAGSSFGRDPDGSPNGVLVEHGANQRVLRAQGSDGIEAEVDLLVRTSEHLAGHGVVAVTDMFCSPTPTWTQLELYQAAQARGWRQTTRIFYAVDDLDEAVLSDLGEGRVRVGGLKLFLDGSISNRTAWMSSPFAGGTGTGLRTASRDALAAAVDLARRHGVQLAVHAMGDAAVGELVDVVGDEEPWMEAWPSVRVEHASVLPADLVDRLAAARVRFGVATNVDFFFAEHGSYGENLTAAQYARTYPVRDLSDRLGPVALSSDSPATTWPDPADPFVSLQAAVTRTAYDGAEIVAGQAVGVGRALLLHTSRAASVTDFGDVGRIAVGAEASFAVLDRDLFRIDPTTILDTQVLGTWIQGEQVFAR